MKKIFLTVVFVLGLSASSWAALYTGTLNSSADGGLFATGDWFANSSLSWAVDYDGSTKLWKYDYTFTVTKKGISHVITEVSEVPEKFTSDNIKDGTTAGYDGPKTYSNQDGNSNPGMPDPGVWGIKWDTPTTVENLRFNWVIVTDRAPMWGDFYSKDGNADPKVYAYNTGFGKDTSALIANGNAMNGGQAWALVPDSKTVPAPDTFLLLGSGLLGLGLYRRRKISK